MAKTVNVNFRMDANLKKEMEKICDDIGLNMTTAFTIFAKRFCKDKCFPFSLSNNFNEDTIKALKEVQDIAKHPENYKSYDNVDNMIKDILK